MPPTPPHPHKKRTLLVVLAHPDDESFGIGGTLALYAQRGIDVYLICATGGEVGTVDPEYLQNYNSIAELREAELRCAAEKLGLTDVYMLGYRDSGMPGSPDNEHPQALAAQPVETVAAQVVHYIRKLRPDVVVTFDPIGGYLHPDHIAIHEAAVHAFHTSGDAGAYPDEPLPPYRAARLYYSTIPKGFLRLAVFIYRLFGGDPRRFGRNKDIDLVRLTEEGNFPVHTQVNYRPMLKVREAAAACHASQLAGGPPNRGPISWFLRLFAGKDQFMRAYPEPEPGLRERDLFEAL